MKSTRPWMVRVRSTAHFFVFMMGVSPTAFSRMSTAGEGRVLTPQTRAPLATSLAVITRSHRRLASPPARHRTRPPARPDGVFSPHYFSSSCRRRVPQCPASRPEGEPGRQPPLQLPLPGLPPRPRFGPRSEARQAAAPPLPPCCAPAGGSDATATAERRSARRFAPCGASPSRQVTGGAGGRVTCPREPFRR